MDVRAPPSARVTRGDLEVGEEVLGTQVDDEGSDGPRLVEGIVDEEAPCGERGGGALPGECQGGATFNEHEGRAVDTLKLTWETCNRQKQTTDKWKVRGVVGA